MIGIMAAGQLGQAAQAQILPPQTEPEPVQAQVPPWTLHTSLSVTEQYNDNVFASTGPNDPSAPERSDMVTILTPTLTISRKTERLTIDVNYQPSFNFYAKYHDELNYISQSGQITLGVKNLGPGVLQYTNLNISDAVAYTQESLYSYPLPGGVTGNGGIITQRTKSWNNTTVATLTQQLTGELQGAVSYEYALTRYRTQGLTDSDEQALGLSLSDRWSQRTTVSARYSYSKFIYDVANANRQVTQSIVFGLDYAAAPTLQTQISIGASHLSSNNDYYPIGSASLTKQFHYTSVTVRYDNSFSSGGGITDAPTINQSGMLFVTRTLGPHARADVRGGYTDQQTSTTPTAVTRSFTIGASANYDVTKWMGAAISYGHSAQQGNNSAAGQDIRWNTVAISLNGTWGTPIQ